VNARMDHLLTILLLVGGPRAQEKLTVGLISFIIFVIDDLHQMLLHCILRWTKGFKCSPHKVEIEVCMTQPTYHKCSC